VTRTAEETRTTRETGASARPPSDGALSAEGEVAIDADRVFAALADPRRRELLELLGGTAGCSASSLAARMPVSRQAVAQHLFMLEESSLVTRRRAGREVLFSVRPEALAAAAEWLTRRAALWAERLQ
jgi:DNA-binding transcriptional ArsR family regulator